MASIPSRLSEAITEDEWCRLAWIEAQSFAESELGKSLITRASAAQLSTSFITWDNGGSAFNVTLLASTPPEVRNPSNGVLSVWPADRAASYCDGVRAPAMRQHKKRDTTPAMQEHWRDVTVIVHRHIPQPCEKADYHTPKAAYASTLHGPFVGVFDAESVWVGNGSYCDTTSDGVNFRGNSILLLLQLQEPLSHTTAVPVSASEAELLLRRYVYVGEAVFEFLMSSSEPVLEFVGTVRNSGVPYAAVLTSDRVLFPSFERILYKERDPSIVHLDCCSGVDFVGRINGFADMKGRLLARRSADDEL